MSDELTREHAMAEIIEALQAKVTALEQERDEWHKKADDLFAVYTQWDKLDKAEAIAKANDLAARVRVLEEERDKLLADDYLLKSEILKLDKQLATAQQELAELKLAMNCPLALSCLCCGKLMQPTDIAVRWRDSMIVVCFACRDARANVVEECAKVAENPEHWSIVSKSKEAVCKEIASAIRALKQQAQS